MVFKCPECKRTRFHIEKTGKNIRIRCEAQRSCGWEMEVVEK